MQKKDTKARPQQNEKKCHKLRKADLSITQKYAKKKEKSSDRINIPLVYKMGVRIFLNPQFFIAVNNP